MAEPSRELRKNRAIRRLRQAVLVAAVLAVAGVTALLIARRSGSDAPAVEDLDADDFAPSGELVTVGEGFERTFSEGDRPVFTVQGDKYAVDREGMVFLEGVAVAVYQEDGSSYLVEGARGRFEVEKREGRLTGGVRITTASGVTATMEELHIREGGNLLASQGPRLGHVELSLADSYEGSAEKLWIHPRNRLLHLRGNVELRGVDEARGFRLVANNLRLDLNRNTVQADGAAILRRPGEVVRARRIVAFLAEETRAVRFVRARWDVWARLNRRGALAGLDLGGGGEEDGAGPEISRIIVQCEDLGLLLGADGEEARELEMQDGPRGVAILTAIEVGAEHGRVLEAPRITAELEDGLPVRAVAEGGVVFKGPGPERAPEGQRATGDRATAAFDEEGTLVSVTLAGNVALTQGTLEAIAQRGVFHVREDRGELEGGVVVTDQDLEATGERGVFDVAQDSGTLFGRPAVVTTGRGRMEAPEVRYSGAAGLVHGTGGVRARLDDAGESALAGSPLARGSAGEGDPIRVEAEEGFFRDHPRGFLFSGRVRAWRGDDLVVADQLRGDEPEGRVVATGNVRTLFHPQEADEEDPEPATEDAAGGGPRLGDAPLEVDADEMVYRRPERLLVYTGDVSALQEGRTVTCREMEVELAEDGGVGHVTCTGDVRVVEPPEGRTLEGHRAVYDPETRTIVVTAAPGARVTLRDAGGNELTGPQMTYDLETGEERVTRPGGGP